MEALSQQQLSGLERPVTRVNQSEAATSNDTTTLKVLVDVLLKVDFFSVVHRVLNSFPSR